MLKTLLKTFLLLLVLLSSFLATALPAGAQEEADEPDGPAHLVVGTLGGVQFWTDELIFHDWRIQRHAWTNHCRLLDGKNIRRGWGDFDDCYAALEAYKRECDPPRMTGKVVLLLHGLCRSRASMEATARYLAEHSDYRVIPLSYASTRAEVADHALALASVVRHLEDVEEIHFVAHSLGNLVVRHYFGDRAAAGDPVDPRIKRVVMLSPPNNGSRLAEVFENNPIFRVVWGRSGIEIADWKALEQHLATPPCEFGIVAGGVRSLDNPLVKGDDDGVVSVLETRLPGAADFLVVPSIHGNIMANKQACEATLQFLRNGCFVTPEARQPIH
ncbi:esterase/lipase family protein [Lignipirellula cremea]|uniref:Alpha/beta hydrolase family protein n=1 Tax=Lignipirellula cremea TaxID=2528010 RepID=A0A518DNV1_9BACT|nr:alpha/beta hydrolase [Lignipirellula cremea]QDU93511.1 Alpha/beta hydrolase family protein [Lignipirellula cremea]